MRPHAAQVLGIFRLLGMEHTYPSVVPDGFRQWAAATSDWAVDSAINFANVATGEFVTLANHVAQIRTGQGKSVTLAGLSTVLALCGFEVHCACYSDYLSSRDYNGFKVGPPASV